MTILRLQLFKRSHSMARIALPVAAALAFQSPVHAGTPADTLVEAFALDELITLDPAEAFEVSSGEITGNTYDRLVRLDNKDPAKIISDIAESWSVSDDGLNYTFELKPGLNSPPAIP